MKFTKNKNLAFFTISLCCLFAVFMQAEEQSTENQLTSTEQVAVPTLTEQEILQFLKNKFATMQVAPDVNPGLIARMLYWKDYNTIAKLEQVIFSVQKLAQDQADYQNNLNYLQGLPKSAFPVITRQHISSVLHDKLAAEKSAWLVYMLVLNKRAIAVHESGHAIAIVHLLRKYKALTEVSMIGDNGTAQAFASYVDLKSNELCNAEEFIHYCKNWIIILLSGGITEQIFGLSQYTQLYSLLAFEEWMKFRKPYSIGVGLQGILSSTRTSSDVKTANKYAQRLIELELTHQTKDDILQECYDQAYQFILDHKDDVIKLADRLMKNDVIFGEEVYQLLGVERPLFDFEEEIIAAETQIIMPVVAQPTKNKKVLLAAATKNKKKKQKGKR